MPFAPLPQLSELPRLALDDGGQPLGRREEYDSETTALRRRAVRIKIDLEDMTLIGGFPGDLVLEASRLGYVLLNERTPKTIAHDIARTVELLDLRHHSPHLLESEPLPQE